jgi:tetratricopeptide (TPR) repeat protein
MEEALLTLAKELPVNHPDRLETELNLVNFLLFTGEHQRSMARADALLETMHQHGNFAAVDQANILRSRGMALTQSDRFDDAISSLQQAIDLSRILQPPRPALTAAFLNDLGNAFTYANDQSAAIDAYRDSYAIQSEIYGAAHKRTLTSGSNLVHAMRSAGQVEQAIDMGEQVLSTSLSAHGPVHRTVVLARFALALALSDSGRNAEADEQMSLDIEALRQLDDLRVELPNHLAWRGEILIRQGQFVSAITLLEEAESLRDMEFPDEPRRYRVAAQQRLVQALAAQGDCERARAYLTPIAGDMADGHPDQAMATEIYLLNCSEEAEMARRAYEELIVAIAGRTDINASLRAALRWAAQSGKFSG